MTAPRREGPAAFPRSDDPNRCVAPARDVRAARTGGELVLLHLGRGHYYTLNETGAWIWERLGSGATFAELCAAIVERFEIDEPVARADLVELFDELEREGLIEGSPAPLASD